MDVTQRAILERNRVLLVENVILTDEFYQLLRSECILPDTMIRDIQSGKTARERNSILLDRLQLRAGNAYKKFRHVLFLTGHHFLTDHLYTEECDTKVLKAEDLFSRFQNVFHHISDDTKARLLRYLESKVKEKALINVWTKSGSDRMDFLENKKSSFYTEKDLTNRLDNKTKKVKQLEDENYHLKDEIKKQEKEIGQLRRDVSDTRQCMKDDLATQSRFNAANNSSIIQLRDRFNSFNERVRILNVYIGKFLNPEEATHIDDDQDNVKIAMLEMNVKKLVQVAMANMETSSSSMNEKEMVMSILNTSSSHKQDSLSEIVEQYVKREEKGKHALAKEFEGILEVLRGNKFTAKVSAKPKMEMKWLKSQAAVIKEELEHLRKKLEWKDNQITELIQETIGLKDKQQQKQHQQTHQPPPAALTLPRLNEKAHPESPDSMKEMEKVYLQLDRYIGEAKNSSQRRTRKRRGSLADVNLEPPSPDQSEVNAPSRRNSKIDICDLDILGTSRRSSVNLKSTSLGDVRAADLRDSRESKPFVNADDILRNKELPKRRIARQENAPSFSRQEARRPSLAELVTIYEKSRESEMPLPECDVAIDRCS